MKTLEDHLNRAGEEMRQASSHLPPVRVPRIRPVRNRLIAGVAVAIAISAVVVPLILVNLPPTDQVYPANVGPGEVVLLEEPLVVRGANSPEPLFDTSSLGAEEPFLEPSDVDSSVLQVEQNLLSPEDEVVKYVVAGELASGSMAGIVQTAGERGWCLWIIPPTEARPSCSGRNNNDQDPLVAVHPGTDLPTDSEKSQGTNAWGPLAPEVSVVTVAFGDTALWQQPVGGIALFDIDNPDQDRITYTAYDEQGNVVAEAIVGGVTDTAVAAIGTMMGGEPLSPEELERIIGATGFTSVGYLIDSTTAFDGAYELGLIVYRERSQPVDAPMICFSEYAITEGVNVGGGAQCATSLERAEEVAEFGLGAGGACGPHPKEEPVVDGNWLTLAVWGIPETTPSLTVGTSDGTNIEVETRNGVGLHIWEGKVDITSITFEGITQAQADLISSWMPIEGIADDCNQSDGAG